MQTAVPNGEWRTPEPTDLIFPKWQRELFKTILDEEKLRFDREGQPRGWDVRTLLCRKPRGNKEEVELAEPLDPTHL